MTTFYQEIPRRAHICTAGEERLEPGMEYFSILNENGQRSDFCPSCWKQEFLNGARSYWKSIVPTKAQENPLPKTRDARVLHLLKEALAEQSFDEAFVLALYLARKRLLLLRNEIKEEMMQVYEVAETEEMLCIKKFPLSELDTEKIQLSIAAKING